MGAVNTEKVKEKVFGCDTYLQMMQIVRLKLADKL
jgi:hypothetical protein